MHEGVANDWRMSLCFDVTAFRTQGHPYLLQGHAYILPFERRDTRQAPATPASSERTTTLSQLTLDAACLLPQSLPECEHCVTLPLLFSHRGGGAHASSESLPAKLMRGEGLLGFLGFLCRLNASVRCVIDNGDLFAPFLVHDARTGT